MPVSGQTSHPATGQTAAPAPPTQSQAASSEETPIVAKLGRGDIAIDGRGIFNVPGCITVEVL